MERVKKQVLQPINLCLFSYKFLKISSRKKTYMEGKVELIYKARTEEVEQDKYIIERICKEIKMTEKESKDYKIVSLDYEPIKFLGYENSQETATLRRVPKKMLKKELKNKGR